MVAVIGVDPVKVIWNCCLTGDKSYGIIVSVVVSFLYILKDSVFVVLAIVESRKFNL